MTTCPYCNKRESKYSNGECSACYKRRRRANEPDFQRLSLESSREWKRRNREHTKRYDAEYAAKHRKPCPKCGGEMGHRATIHCRICMELEWASRRTQMIDLYNAGVKMKDMADMLGTTVNSLGTQLVRLRKAGVIGRRRGQ